MANKMLIDASHPEETRVVVVRGQKVEEFDFESANRKQLRGNIYLAKVTRVEPSLQAAFVEYGGNRHGFLAFSEIHPDYYQIPVADRQALLEAEAEAQREDEHEEERRSNRRRRRTSQRRTENDETVVSTEAEAGSEENAQAVSEGEAAGDAETVRSADGTAISEATNASAPSTEGATVDEGAEARKATTTRPRATAAKTMPTRNWTTRIPKTITTWKSTRSSSSLAVTTRSRTFPNADAPPASSTRFRKSSSAARSFWFRSSRKSVATRARR
jgi:ribonuclease E